MQQELDYLQRTKNSLQKTYTVLSSHINEKDASYKDLQKYLMDYKAELDKFEVFDYQQSLHMIDKQGYQKVLERQQVEKLLDSPYFGRFDFLYDGDDEEDVVSFYIGRFGHVDEEGTTLVYDWRAPICNMYYEFELGSAHYTTNDKRFEGELTGKKQIKIENGELIYAMDSNVTIQDAVLQETLNNHSSDKMKTIITSIQREQNQIVRNESAANMIIQGVAGSGKTAVALHRLAYYLYKFRDSLRPERIFILSPNKVFGDYISSVLPELGEQPIRSFTIDELTANLLPSAVTFVSFEEEIRDILVNPSSALTKRAKLKADYKFVQQIDAYLEQLNSTIFKYEDISIADVKFSADYLQGRFLSYKKEPVLTRLTLMVDDIVSVLKSKRNGEGKLPSRNDILSRLKKRLTFVNPLAIYRDFLAQFEVDVFHFKNKRFECNDVYPYLYVQLYYKGMKTYELVQHFVLDEMQDYTPIQYAVLRKVFDCKRTIIGDFSQALLPYETISKEAFHHIFRDVEYVQLTTTYRSTYEIAMYSKKFLRTGELHPIARHGEEPEELTYVSEGDMLNKLERAITEHAKTTAIICKNEPDVQKITDKLTIPYSILNGDTLHFASGVIVTTIQYAKGLEFDHVIVPYVDETCYTNSFDQGLLYIATTRALHKLTMLIDEKNPSPLL